MNLIWTFGRTPWTGDQTNARPLPTQDNTTQKNVDTSMPQVGFQPMIPVSEQPKTAHVLGHVAIGSSHIKIY